MAVPKRGASKEGPGATGGAYGVRAIYHINGQRQQVHVALYYISLARVPFPNGIPRFRVRESLGTYWLQENHRIPFP